MISLKVETRSWRLREPFVISRQTYETSDVIVVEIASGRCVGRGEAAGVDYHGETPARMQEQVESVRAAIENGVTRSGLLELLPAGGARNAVDAALWDLEAKQKGKPVWQLAGFDRIRPVVTAVTIGIRSIAEYEERARALNGCEWVKVKVTDEDPLEAVKAVRRGAPDARLIVDANQAWDVPTVYALGTALKELRVELLEQPVGVDKDSGLIAGRSVIPVCADESIDTADDLPRLRDRYDVVNIKLDKTGGLTAALQLAHAARECDLRLMVGCMVAGSVAMAPGMVLAQMCDYVDLDGPLLQAEDWQHGIEYEHGVMSWPSSSLWS